jgi:hypothetical protein
MYRRRHGRERGRGRLEMINLHREQKVDEWSEYG